MASLPPLRKILETKLVADVATFAADVVVVDYAFVASSSDAVVQTAAVPANLVQRHLYYRRKDLCS